MFYKLLLVFALTSAGLESTAGQVDADYAAFWQKVTNDLPNLPPFAVAERKALVDESVMRLTNNPSYLRFLRNEMRRGQNSVSRGLAAAHILAALGAKADEDCMYLLSTQDESLRVLAYMQIRKYKMEALAAELPVMLLGAEGAERKLGLKAIREILGDRGLPYYCATLRDKDPTVATEAAKCLAECRKTNVAPIVLRFLEERGKKTPKVVLEALFQSLERVYGEPNIDVSDRKKGLRAWTAKLKEE